MAFNTYGKKKKPPIYDESLGEPPTDEQLEKMAKQAKNVAYYWVDQAEKSRHELFTKIKNKGITDDIANEVLDKMEELGYLDDNRFAENFVYSKQTYDKLGARAITYKLKLKGVPQDIIDAALAGIDEESEEENAKLIALRKARVNKKLDTNKRIQQIAGMLARKGYSGSMIFRLAKEAVEEVDSE